MKKLDVEAYQMDWHSEVLHGQLPRTADTFFMFGKWDRLVEMSATEVERKGRVLDVACGDARDIAFLSLFGWEAWGLDPSPLQLRDAKRAAEQEGHRISLVQGVAEWLPFKDDAFISLMCKSALDHMVDPDGAMQEFARVVEPGGRAVVSVNNYRSLSTRVSRLLYRVVRFLWPPARRRPFMWDTPVGAHHTYECTFDNTRALGAPYFHEARAYGVSLLWGFPGWGRLLGLLPKKTAGFIMDRLDKVARRVPRLADVVVFVWQPKASRERTAQPEAEAEGVRVQT